MEQRIEQLRNAIAASADTDAALLLLREVGELLGFSETGVVYDVAGNRPLLDAGRQADLLGWPKEIVDRWSANGYCRQHPAYMRCRFSKMPFAVDNAAIWDDAPAPSRAQAQMRCDISELGLRTMLTVPVHLPLGHTAAINWIAREAVPTQAIIERYGHQLLAIGHSFMAARTPDYEAVFGDLAHLTDRQIDCLALLASGRTVQETGMLLAISEHTVRDHLRAICERLDAVSTTHAVALAAQLGIIDPVRH